MSETWGLEKDIDLITNPEPRCPCVLLIDTSKSMRGAPIEALNHGLWVLWDDLLKDPVASTRVELAVVSFNSEVKVVCDFRTVEQFAPPTLTATGWTHMGSGINHALDVVQARKEQYRSKGIGYYRPWVFMITDGEPQGEDVSIVNAAAERIKDEEANRRVCFFGVGVQGANMSRLESLLVRKPMKLNGLNFAEMFVWLSQSTGQVSRSRIDDQQVPLPPVGWGTTW